MLYDQRWDNPKPWSLRHLAKWLSTKHGTYNYYSGRNCMCAQYAKDLGYKGVRATGSSVTRRIISWLPGFVHHEPLPHYFNQIACNAHDSFDKAYQLTIEILEREHVE